MVGCDGLSTLGDWVNASKPNVSSTDTKATKSDRQATTPSLVKPAIPSESNEPSASPSHPTSHPRLPAPPSPDFAVVLTKDGVVVLDTQGSKVGVLSPTRPQWCRLDPRASVLWMMDQDKLSLIDLNTDAEPIVLLDHPPETVIIEYSDEKLGDEHPWNFEAGVRLIFDDQRLHIEATVGCDADMQSCFDDDIEDLKAAKAAYLEQLAAKVDASLKARPWPEKELAPIIARAKTRRATLEPPHRAPPPQKVKMSSTELCLVEPEDCGKAEVLIGTRYWRVLFANDLEDLLREQFHVYDPQRKMFFDPIHSQFSDDAEAFEPFEPEWISPSGELATDFRHLVSFDHGVLADISGTCGFWGGGWEL